VQGLSSLFYEYIATDPGGFNYEVSVSSESGRGGGIHASEASKCARKLVYSIQNTERRVGSKRDPNMIMRFRVGTALHAMLQNDWDRIAGVVPNNLEFESEINIHPGSSELAKEFDIYSSCDGIFTLLDEKREPLIRVGLEIKSSSAKEFENRRSPESDHVEQSTIYQACLDLPLMWVLYYNKSNSNITTSFKPWLFKFNTQLWEKMQRKFVKSHHQAATQELPERAEGMHCKWCPYSYTCQPQITQSRQPLQISAGMGVRR
jgi:CRISPR/Cas system-associated exonuclease Cas4 (RecB family)